MQLGYFCLINLNKSLFVCRYLHGAGTDQNHSMAAEYFKMAAEQGHPHAKFNLAVGHLKGTNQNITHNGNR